jgi:hypothetical protein
MLSGRPKKHIDPDPQNSCYEVNVQITFMLMHETGDFTKIQGNKILSPPYHVSGEEAEGGALLEVVRLVLHDGVLVHFTKPSQSYDVQPVFRIRTH